MEVKKQRCLLFALTSDTIFIGIRQQQLLCKAFADRLLWYPHALQRGREMRLADDCGLAVHEGRGRSTAVVRNESIRRILPDFFMLFARWRKATGLATERLVRCKAVFS